MINLMERLRKLVEVMDKDKNTEVAGLIELAIERIEELESQANDMRYNFDKIRELTNY